MNNAIYRSTDIAYFWFILVRLAEFLHEARRRGEEDAAVHGVDAELWSPPVPGCRVHQAPGWRHADTVTAGKDPEGNTPVNKAEKPWGILPRDVGTLTGCQVMDFPLNL